MDRGATRTPVAQRHSHDARLTLHGTRTLHGPGMWIPQHCLGPHVGRAMSPLSWAVGARRPPASSRALGGRLLISEGISEGILACARSAVAYSRCTDLGGYLGGQPRMRSAVAYSRWWLRASGSPPSMMMISRFCFFSASMRAVLLCLSRSFLSAPRSRRYLVISS